jgi:hypothetical protein
MKDRERVENEFESAVQTRDHTVSEYEVKRDRLQLQILLDQRELLERLLQRAAPMNFR